MAFPPHPQQAMETNQNNKPRFVLCEEFSFGLSSDSNSIADKVSESGQYMSKFSPFLLIFKSLLKCMALLWRLIVKIH